MSRYREETTMVRMRRNVRKKVMLSFKHYELRIKAEVNNGHKTFETILPSIKMKYLKRWFVREEVVFELRKLKGVKDADLLIEVFGIYGTETSLGEYARYLGELQIFVSGLDDNARTMYNYKNSLAYFEQPEKSNFITPRIQDIGNPEDQR